MSRQDAIENLTVDFLVPACLASRYRARLVAVSETEAEIQLSICPKMFRSGELTACPAEISLIVGAVVVRRRGLFEIEGAGGRSGTTGHFVFEEPVDGGDLDLLRGACHVAKQPGARRTTWRRIATSCAARPRPRTALSRSGSGRATTDGRSAATIVVARSPERGGLVLVVGDKVRIPLREIGFRFVRSSGPGGQNVNKVASKAVLRWSAATSPSVAEDVRGRLLARFAARITSEGDLVLACDRHRERERNRDECLERLRQMLAAVDRSAQAATQDARAARGRGATLARQADARREEAAPAHRGLTEPLKTGSLRRRWRSAAKCPWFARAMRRSSSVWRGPGSSPPACLRRIPCARSWRADKRARSRSTLGSFAPGTARS